MAVIYTTVDKVANRLGFPNSYFDGSSTPTSTVVEELINSAEDSIDNMTSHAWRTTTVTEESVRPSSVYRHGTGIRLDLIHRSNISLTKLEVWDGSDWIDWVATKTEGRGDDYWVDDQNGIVFLNTITRLYPHGVRITYTYGESAVNGMISSCATMMAALQVLNSPEFSVVLFTQVGENKPSWAETKETWQKQIDKIIDNNTEFQ